MSRSISRAAAFAVLPGMLLGAACANKPGSTNNANSANAVAGAPVATVATATGTGVAGAAASAGGLTETTTDNKFSSTSLSATAGAPTNLVFTNKGAAIHNWHLLDVKDADGKDIKVDLLEGGKSQTISFTIGKSGTYHFQCDVHPTEMKGTLKVS